MAGGHVVDSDTLVDHGDPADRFDVVILSEGFQQKELGIFDAYAEYLATGLLDMAPFRQVKSLINVHVVRTASTDSGVTNFPIIGVAKKTLFEVRGDFDGTGFAGFFGTDSPEAIWEAARVIAPKSQLELFVVILNAQGEGASGFFDQQLAITALWGSKPEFLRFAAHECGHAIANLAEEYIGCNPHDDSRAHLNQATEEERNAGTVWWKSLAKPSELKADGSFRAVHELGDPFMPNGEQPKVKPSLKGKLGLYWGCQDVPPEHDHPNQGCDAWKDPHGASFYRALARCRMRRSTYAFCRVCRHLITEVITQTASP
jgi:IgA Peptidase M64